MPLQRIIPWLIPFFIDALVALRLPFLGRILSIFQRPISDADALQQLNEAQNWRPKKRPGFSDTSRVVKVSDAIACLQSQVNDRRHWIAVAKELVASLVGTPKNSMIDLGEATADCIRNKALQQLGARTKRLPKQKYHRPAIGHGHGRTSF